MPAVTNIPGLPAGTSVNGTEEVWVVQNGRDVRLTSAQIAALGGGTSGPSNIPANLIPVNGVLTANGTASVVVTDPGITGQVLTSNGPFAPPSMQPAPAGTVAGGGTGLNNLIPQGGLLVANGTNPINITDPGTVGQVLTSNGAGVPPTMQNASASSGTVPNGGTGRAVLAIHGVIIGEGISPVNVTTPGAAGQVLTSNGASADPTFQAIPTPIIDVPHGGTGVNTLFAHGLLVGSGASAVVVTSPGTAGQVLTSNGASADPTMQSLNATVPQGGTGVVTLAAHGVIIGEGASPVTVAAPGTAGQVLTSNGAAADPTMQTIPIPNINVAHGGTGVATLAAHGVVIGEGTSPVTVAVPGTAGQILTSNGPGADPTFQAAGLTLGWVIAVPGGAADVTAAVQASINAAQAAGATLYFPAGTYTVSLGTRYALLISSPLNVIMDPNAKIVLKTTASFAGGWGISYSTVVGVLTIQSSNVMITGGQFDWGTTNSGLFGYCGLIYVTTGNPGVGGPYYTDIRLDGMKIRNSRGSGIWTEDTTRLWVVNTNHAGGTATDILNLRSLISPVDVHIDYNYIDSSTIPIAGVNASATPIQLSINFTGSPGQTTDRWSMNHNIIEAGLNTNVYYTATQIYSPFNIDGVNGAWRRGEAIGNYISGATGGGGPLGGAEAISAVMVTDSVITNNVIKNCYIGIEFAAFNSTCSNNSIDGGGSYMAVGLFLDGGGLNNTIADNTITGFGGWPNYQAISSRTAGSSFIGNVINSMGSGQIGTGLILYVDGENSTLGNDNTTVVGNKFHLSGASIAMDIYDTSFLNVSSNVVNIETPTNPAIRLQAPGTYSHLPRNNIKVKNNVLIGGSVAVSFVASGDWGSNIDIEGLASGAVIQATSKSTAVAATNVFQIDITMNAAALAAGAIVSFNWPNNFITANDNLDVRHVSGGTLGAYDLNGRCSAGAGTIDVRNGTPGPLAEAIVLRVILTKSKAT